MLLTVTSMSKKIVTPMFKDFEYDDTKVASSYSSTFFFFIFAQLKKNYCKNRMGFWFLAQKRVWLAHYPIEKMS